MSGLADAIVRRLAAGLELDAAGRNCLLAALDTDDADRALALLAADPESCENASLTALLFSPAAAAMRGLEPALAAADLDATGAAALERAVAGRLAGTRLPVLLPGGGRSTYPAAAEDLTGYVRRLAPAATPPADLRAALRPFPPETAAGLGVILRHSGLAWTAEREFFLATLFDRTGRAASAGSADSASPADPAGLVAWAVNFLDVAGLPFRPRQALFRRYEELEAQLLRAEAAERALSRGNFETRLAQGLRPGYVHAPDIRQELAFLDRACRLTLGVPAAKLAAGVTVRDLGDVADINELLRRMP